MKRRPKWQHQVESYAHLHSSHLRSTFSLAEISALFRASLSSNNPDQIQKAFNGKTKAFHIFIPLQHHYSAYNTIRD